MVDANAFAVAKALWAPSRREMDADERALRPEVRNDVGPARHFAHGVPGQPLVLLGEAADLTGLKTLRGSQRLSGTPRGRPL